LTKGVFCKECAALGWAVINFGRFAQLCGHWAYYYAVVPLDDGAEAILTGVNDLLDGKKRLGSR
jgi:hypothetical protein